MPAGYVDILLTQKSSARYHKKKLAGMTVDGVKIVDIKNVYFAVWC